MVDWDLPGSLISTLYATPIDIFLCLDQALQVISNNNKGDNIHKYT